MPEMPIHLLVAVCLWFRAPYTTSEMIGSVEIVKTPDLEILHRISLNDKVKLS